MLKKSPYRFRYIYAFIISLVLASATAFVFLDSFVIARAEEAIVPDVAMTFATPTPEPSPTPVETVYTDTEYTDENIRITVTKVEANKHVYYVADVQLNSLAYFKTAFAENTFGRNIAEKTSVMALENNAILATNGDFYGSRNSGLIIRNGTLYRDKAKDESLVLMQDGEMRIVDESVSGESLIAQGAYQSWSFGPTLVIDGQYVERETTIGVSNPRTGIGMIEPYHYIFIVAEGRLDDAIGIRIKDFAQLFIDYGCTVAYNLDGGGSATMVMHKALVNRPSQGSERKVSDIIYIGY